MIEAARMGISESGLDARIECESSWQWNNEYGDHYGLGQFEPATYSRGLSTIGSRLVEIRERSERPGVAYAVEQMSDGTQHTIRRWRVRQIVVRIKRGAIPRDPPLEHGWAQVRIMAEAIAGRSAVSSGEWSCGA